MTDKIYVTKYALTTGIVVYAPEEYTILENGLVECRKVGDSYRSYFHKNEWWKHLDLAKVTSEQMRKKRIESLAKSITKMQTMEIKVIE